MAKKNHRDSGGTARSQGGAPSSFLKQRVPFAAGFRRDAAICRECISSLRQNTRAEVAQRDADRGTCT